MTESSLPTTLSIYTTTYNTSESNSNSTSEFQTSRFSDEEEELIPLWAPYVILTIFLLSLVLNSFYFSLNILFTMARLPPYQLCVSALLCVKENSSFGRSWCISMTMYIVCLAYISCPNYYVAVLHSPHYAFTRPSVRLFVHTMCKVYLCCRSSSSRLFAFTHIFIHRNTVNKK